MRRTLFVAALVAAAGVAAALVATAVANEREFDRLMARGDRAVAEDRPFPAIEAYSGAIALRADSMVAHLKRGAVYSAQGELDAALRDLRLAVDIDPTAPRPLDLLGDVNASLGRLDRAIDAYERSLALDERSPRVLYKLAVARYRAGRTAAARDALASALRLDPGFGEAHYLLGLVLRDDGRLPEARRAFEEAQRRMPAATAPREALAEVFALAGNHARALDELQALAALDASRPDRAVAVGLALARAGRHDAAVLALGRAIERFPDSPQAFAALGHVWLAMAESRGDSVALKKAIEALAQAASRSDASGDTLAELARASALAGDASGAERALRQAVTRLPVPPDAFVQLAALTGRDGRTQEARDWLMRYAALVGDTQPLGRVAADIAAYSIELGEPAVAVHWYERAMASDGPSPALRLRLADAAWKAGDVVRAHRVVDEGLAQSPSDRALLQLRRRLPARPPAP